MPLLVKFTAEILSVYQYFLLKKYLGRKILNEVKHYLVFGQIIYLRKFFVVKIN